MQAHREAAARRRRGVTRRRSTQGEWSRPSCSARSNRAWWCASCAVRTMRRRLARANGPSRPRRSTDQAGPTSPSALAGAARGTMSSQSRVAAEVVDPREQLRRRAGRVERGDDVHAPSRSRAFGLAVELVDDLEQRVRVDGRCRRRGGSRSAGAARRRGRCRCRPRSRSRCARLDERARRPGPRRTALRWA